jgi:hypothetical protein
MRFEIDRLMLSMPIRAMLCQRGFSFRPFISLRASDIYFDYYYYATRPII